MKTKNTNCNERMRVAKTEFEVPYGDRTITFVPPLVGSLPYRMVMSQISQNRLLRPTTEQTLALVNLALQNPNEEYYKTILDALRLYGFWTSTENLWGDEDVIIYDNVEENMPSDRTSLIKRMKDGDTSVRVVPYGFAIGDQSISDFVRNPYVIAQAGNLPSDIVADIAKKFNPKNEANVSAYASPPQNGNRKYSKIGGGYYYLTGYSDLTLSGWDSDFGLSGCALGLVTDKK